VKVQTALEKFIQNLKNKGRSISTILAYKKDIEQLIENVGNKTVDKINSQEIESFKKKLTKNGYTAKSVSRKINAIKSFFRFCQEKKWIDNDPAASVSHPKYKINTPRILSKIEYRALRDAARENTRMSTIIELLLQTGMRIGELARLKLNDIQMKKGFLRIAAYQSQPERKVPLNNAAKRALRRYLKVRPNSQNQSLFLTKTGRSLLVRNIRSAINRYFRLAEVKNARVNDLRHTFIVHQLSAGVPLLTVSQIVGHKRISTTEKYLQLVKEKGKERVKLEEL